MCWKCDHPEATMADWIAHVWGKIDRRGWAIQYVEDGLRSFAYTIGLHDFGLPELLITGVAPASAQRLLNDMAERTIIDGMPAAGSQVPTEDPPFVEIVEVDHPEAHMGMASAIQGSNYTARQLVWADVHGALPWDPDFDHGRSLQPVFGVRALSDRRRT